MDERYELLCEIGQVLMDADRKELLKVYIDLMLEHYPVELLEVFGISADSSDSDYEPDEVAEKVSASKEKVVEEAPSEVVAVEEKVVLELQGGEEPESLSEDEGDSSDSGSEDERAAAEMLEVKEEGGFYSLA